MAALKKEKISKWPVDIPTVSENLIQNLRKKIQNDVKCDSSTGIQHFNEMCRYTIALPPNNTTFTPSTIRSKFVDSDMLHELEQRGVLNWCPVIMRLFPLKTPGDGNCILHAISIALWGLPDSKNFLRQLLYSTLCKDDKNSRLFSQRWFISQTQERNYIQNAFDVEHNAFESDFSSIINAVADKQLGNEIDYLEPIHVFVAANILKRPIIVIADQHVRNLSGSRLDRNLFGGIYLPLLVPAEQCTRHPIVLAFDQYHCTPLVAEISSQKCLNYCVPLSYDRSQEFLPIQFLLPPEERHSVDLLQKYLNISEIRDTHSAEGSVTVSIAMLEHLPVPDYDLMAEYAKKINEISQAAISESQNTILGMARVQPHQREIFEEPIPSMTNEKCQYPGCFNFCSNNLLPHHFCYEHVFRDDFIEMHNLTETTKARNDSWPPSKSQLKRQNVPKQKCSVYDCKFYAPPGEGNICEYHKFQPKNTVPLVSGRILCTLCKKHSSKHQYGGICSSCYYKTYNGNKQHQNVLVNAPAMEKVEPNVNEKCIESSCTQLSEGPEKAGMCKKCFEMALKQQLQVENIRKSNDRVYFCNITGCGFPANEHRGYCTNHATLRYKTNDTMQSQELKSVKLCKTELCRNDGLPELNGLCVECREIQDGKKRKTAPRLPSEFTEEPHILAVSKLQVVETAHQIQSPVKPVTIKDEFIKSVKDVEQRSRSGAQNCVRPGCNNYGNSRHKGYCNTCFKELNSE